MSKVSAIITESIIKKLEKGTVPWQKPYLGIDLPPMSFVTHRPYRGTNLFLLYFEYKPSPYWLTWKQATKLGGKPEKGTGVRIVKVGKYIPKNKKEEDIDEEVKVKNYLRYYTVYNLADIEGIECPYMTSDEFVKEISPIQRFESFINQTVQAGLSAPIEEHDRAIACYIPALDVIRSPHITKYKSDHDFYATMFHEMAHSTGHKSRLDRKASTNMKTDTYAFEELIAELTSCFVCNHFGIMNTIDNSASYIAMWLKRFRKDDNLLIRASHEAQRILDYFNLTEEVEYKEPETVETDV